MKKRGLQPMTEEPVNVTPLIDIVMCLIIFFLICGKLVKDETLYRETTASMTNLREILQKVNQGQGTVGKLVNDQEFYRNAKLSLQKLDKATDSLEDQGPLSVVGTMVQYLF